MKLKSYGKKRFFYSSLLLAIFSINMITMSTIVNIYDPNSDENIRSDFFLNVSDPYKEYTTNKQWLINNGFDSVIDPWTNITDNSNSDLDVGYSSGEAEILVYGDVRTESVILDASTYSSWTSFQKSNLSVDPNDNYGEDADGVFCAHTMNESQSDPRGSVANTPELYWRKNVSLDVDMSDYKITSASLQAVMNATVDPSVDTPNDEHADSIGSVEIDQDAKFDYAQFFVEVADTEVTKENTYEIAFNQTRYLGQDIPSTIYTIGGEMGAKSPQAIIDSITNAIAVDPENKNFTVVLGINMYCEDNVGGVDVDIWDDMRISFVNLTFTYEKKINEDSEVSWNQEGATIPGGSVITEAIFSLKCMVNQTWPTSSPTSELIFHFNGDDHSETIKLRNVSNSSLDEVSFYVTSRIVTGTNINVSIQLYIWDEFTLGQTIKIFIDDVYLNITYYQELEEIETDLDLLIDHADKTLDKSAEAVMGEAINITAIYKNSTGEKITTGATVRITGEGMNQTLSPDGDQYYISLQTTILGYGDKYFKIEASNYTYETQDISFKISVVDRYAIINKVYLNGTDETNTTTIEDLPSGDPLNITIDYLDNYSRNPIENANLTLRDKNTIIGNFSEHESSHNYSCSYNTSGLDQGVYYFTIVAEKKNCTTDYVQIRVIIDAIGTGEHSKLYLNDTLDLLEISTTIESFVKIDYSFRDNTNNDFITFATVDINGSGISKLMPAIGENYSILIDTDELTGSNNRLDIYAAKDGHISQSMTVIIRIVEKQTDVSLFIDNKLKTIPANHIFMHGVVTIGSFLNITIRYTDNSTGNPISLATVNITGGVSFSDNLINDTYDQYTINFSTEAPGLLWGLNYLTIEAKSTNRETQSFTIQINIISKPTDLELFLNGAQKLMNETIEIELPYGSLLNISARYLVNSTNNDLNTAEINLTWRVNSTDYEVGLDKQSNYQNYTLDTTSLGFGRKILYLSASQTNYQPYYAEIKLYVYQRQVELVPSSGDVIDLLTGQNIIITIYLNDTDFNQLLPGAEIMYSSAFGSGILTDPDNDGVYILILDPAAQGTYPISFSVYINDNFEFAQKIVYVSITTSTDESILIMIIQILATAGVVGGIGFASYINAYQTVLKYPKPVRKVRKFRKKLRKKSIKGVDITSRQKSFNKLYKNQLGQIGKILKSKSVELDVHTDQKLDKLLKK